MTDAAANPREHIGANNPPADPAPFDIAVNTVDALRSEAGHWLDGGVIKSAEEASAVTQLVETAREARKFVDAERVKAKKPHDDAAKAVQEQFKPLLHRVETIEAVAKKALTPWREAEEAKRRQEAEAARKKADEEAAAARAAVQSSESLDEREAAEALLKDAKVADLAARRAAKPVATGLRTTIRAEITDPVAFARFAWTNHSDEMAVFLQGIADRLVRHGQRGIPGVSVHEERKAV